MIKNAFFDYTYNKKKNIKMFFDDLQISNIKEFNEIQADVLRDRIL